MSYKVSWKEGMLLQPQHFQQQCRHFEYLIRRNNQNDCDNLWGVESISIDNTLLDIGIFSVSQLSCKFKNNILYTSPNVDELPDGLHVEASYAGEIIYLSIPVDIDDSAYDSFGGYVEKVRTIHDKGTKNHDVEIDVLKLKPKYLLERHKSDNLHLIPIAKILSVDDDKKIKLDDTFIPVCANCSHHSIQNMLLSIIHKISNQREKLLVLASNINYHQVTEIVELLYLLILNKYEVLLTNIKNGSSYSVFNFYETMLSFISELSTILSSSRKPPVLPTYAHHKMGKNLCSLVNVVNELLNKKINRLANKIDLKKHSHGLWVSEKSYAQGIDENKYVLAVKTDASVDTNTDQLSAQIKIAPVERIRDIVTKGIPGIEITRLNTIPRHVQYEVNSNYYLLNAENKLWSQMNGDGELAIHISGGYKNTEVTLWSVKGDL